MSERLTAPARQPPSKPPAIPNQFPQLLARGISTQELSDKINSAKSVALALLKDTSWPPESKDTTQNLLYAINNLPDLPPDVNPVKDDVEEFIHVLEAVRTSLKKASEKYGRKERGIVDGIKYSISSLRRSKCTDILRTCREDIEKASIKLCSRLDSVATAGNEGSDTPSSLQNPSTAPLFEVQSSVVPSESLSMKTKSAEQTITSEHPTSHQPSVQGSSPDSPEDQETRSSIRDGALTAARKTFEAVEIVSGAIPVVGDYVGVAAKVGLGFVNMIETMDKNEDVAKELASDTSKLSKYLEHFRKKSDVGNGDEMAAHVHDLQGELESIQKKVDQWISLGRFKKAFLSSDHADELKGHQDTVQTALEEMQLLVSLKTSDLVIELRDTELRAERRRLLDRLGDGSYGARGSSIEDVVCLPGTRVDILNRINNWIKDTSAEAERVLWIRGMAGRGKSTIASTVAHTWASKGSCAIFHFRRGQNASDDQFVCALARQLGKGLVPEVKNAILDCVKENEDIAKGRLDQQFKTLFVGSLGKLQDHGHPIVIIVDALDECHSVADAVRFVRLIDQHSSYFPANVKFLLTCRPEAPLIISLEPRKWHAEDLDSIPHVSDDITRFIEQACAKIREDHGLPENWPTPADIEGIVGMSQGLFQWARTAITYVGDRSPVHRLRDLLRRSSAWTGLDDLYHQILSKAFNEVGKDSERKQLLSWVLETLVVAPYPVSLEVIAFLHADHEVFNGQDDTAQFLRNDILADLNSLLHIPKSSCEPLRLMHTSIRDLLVTPERCENQDYFVEPIRGHQRLARVGLEIMERDLKQNICNLSDLSKANSEVQDAVESHVPRGLRYCCRVWSIHLIAGVPWSETSGATGSNIVLFQFKVVSEKKVLAWLEVMSLIGAINEAFTVAKRVHQWLLHWPQGGSRGDLATLWNDTQRFITLYLEPISFGALHIYASALLDCPTGTSLWTKYGGQATARILHGERQLDWPADIWTTTVYKTPSNILFSPDGRVLACSLDDKLQFLDAQTGAPVGDPLTGHSKAIVTPSGIAFSPDSKVLASGSYDGTVRLWDVQTGVTMGDPLIGHKEKITFLVFSPDGKALASGSSDNTVRLWDPQTGAPVGDPLTGHKSPIAAIAYSPDGKVLASGSEDSTVRLWDAQTGTPVADPLIGHKFGITCLVFSPDGKVLASGSYDFTIRLWDALTWAPVCEPLPDHGSYLRFVVFSPDSKVLASGVSNTVRLWDAQTGAPVGNPLTGYHGQILSSVTDPYCKVLESGVYNDVIHLWDSQTGALVNRTLPSRKGGIYSVILSLDGKVASASWDRTIRLWDTPTGKATGNSVGNYSSAFVVLSPDGKVLAFVSDYFGGRVQLWDVQTGTAMGDPLTGFKSKIKSLVFSPDGKVFTVLTMWEGTTRLWDAQTGAPVGDPLVALKGDIISVAFSPDSKLLASGSDDCTIRLWDAQTGAPVGDPLVGHKSLISFLVFSPDSKVLASGSDDCTIRLWDAQTGAPVGDPLVGHKSLISFLVFSPDSKVLASSSFDHTLSTSRLWDVRTGTPLGDPPTSHRRWDMTLTFSPDGKLFALRSCGLSTDRKAQLWDFQTGEPVGAPLIGHEDSIDSIVFSPDGKVLASHSSEGEIKLWNPFTCQEYTGPPNDFTLRQLNFYSPWITYNSKRLLWLAPHHRVGRRLKIFFSHGRLAFRCDEGLVIMDVSECLEFLFTSVR